MLTAVKHLGKVGIGITTPQFFRANDGKTYVVKLQHSRIGSKFLVSEFLAAQIGKFMKLCFPPNDIIMVDEKIIRENETLSLMNIPPGMHFASLYLDKTEYLGKNNIAKAANISDMAGIMLFDHMFHNADRANNKKNLLLRQEESEHKIYAIDNSHLFRSGQWTSKSLENLTGKLKIYYRYSFGLLLRDMLTQQDFDPYLEALNNLSDDEIYWIVHSIPLVWLPDELTRNALIAFIKNRCDIAEEIRDKLCKQIPVERGGMSHWGKARIIRLTNSAKSSDTH